MVPDRKALEDWAVNNLHEAVDFKSLCENPKAKKYILDALNSTAQKHKVCGIVIYFLLPSCMIVVIFSSELNEKSTA